MTMHVERNLRNFEIERYNLDMPLDNYKIVEERTIDGCGYEGLIITPIKDLNYIKIVKCNWNEKKCKLQDGKDIFNYKNLIAGYSMLLRVVLPEGIPEYKLCLQRCDYMKGELYIGENGKNGILDESLKMKHTFKSRVYYFVR